MYFSDYLTDRISNTLKKKTDSPSKLRKYLESHLNKYVKEYLNYNLISDFDINDKAIAFLNRLIGEIPNVIYETIKDNPKSTYNAYKEYDKLYAKQEELDKEYETRLQEAKDEIYKNLKPNESFNDEMLENRAKKIISKQHVLDFNNPPKEITKIFNILKENLIAKEHKLGDKAFIGYENFITETMSLVLDIQILGKQTLLKRYESKFQLDNPEIKREFQDFIDCTKMIQITDQGIKNLSSETPPSTKIEKPTSQSAIEKGISV